MKKITLTSIVLSGLLLINTANADQAMDEIIKAAANAVGEANSSNANLRRDHTTQVVTDSSTKLQWEDNAKEPINTTWPKADKHCNSLNFAGHQDWRLATTKELVALAKVTKVKFPKKPILKSIPTFHGEFWTSDTIIDSFGTAAKAVKFDTFDYGETMEATQNLDYSVRCVRNLK